jgi:hypothetical protein
VRSGDANGALVVHDRAEDFRALHDPDALHPRGIHLGVLPFDGGSDHDEVVARDVRRVVTDGDGDPAAGQQIGRGGPLQIAPRDLDAGAGEDLRQSTHPDPADADEMDGANLIKNHPDEFS